jgi:hypothetical protein
MSLSLSSSVSTFGLAGISGRSFLVAPKEQVFAVFHDPDGGTILIANYRTLARALPYQAVVN